MKLAKSQLKQIIKKELNEVGVPFLKTGLGADAVPKGGEQYNLVFKDNGEFFDGPFTKEEAEDILATQDPNEELEIKLATPTKGSNLADIEDFYDKIAARYDENKMKITKSQLKQIIKEELSKVLKEDSEDELYVPGQFLELTVSDDGYDYDFEKLDSAEEYINTRGGAYGPSVKMLVKVLQVAEKVDEDEY